jgi:hypothetical protein
LHLVNIAKEAGASRPLNIVIVGGGETGVELAAELREACANIASYGLTSLEPQSDAPGGLGGLGENSSFVSSIIRSVYKLVTFNVYRALENPFVETDCI